VPQSIRLLFFFLAKLFFLLHYLIMRPTPLNYLFQLIDIPTTATGLVHAACIDSRLVQPGDLFFALKGEKADGHAYLSEVSQRKAVAAVVETSYQGPDFGLSLVRVEDVRSTLQRLAKAYLKQQTLRVIAITGSIGKTTTKEFAKTLIGSSYRIFASPRSYNSQVTVAMNVLSMKGDEEILLLEMGMSAPGHLETLIDIAPPDLALLTTIAPQHAISFTDGLEGIAKEKSRIFAHSKTTQGFYHHDMPYAEYAATSGTCKKQTFSCTDPHADIFLKREGSIMHICEKGGPSYQIPLVLPMTAYDHNFLAALSLARALDIPWPVLKEVAPFVRVPEMRFEKIEKQGITFINDAYNAIPQSMQAALESLPQPQQGGRTVAVLSEMNALGAYSDEGHRSVAQSALQYADVLFCIGDRCHSMEDVWQGTKKTCQRFETVEALGQQLKRFVQSGDVVLLKGARAFALDQLLQLF